MIRSMTGFGAAEGAVGTLRVSVEVRTFMCSSLVTTAPPSPHTCSGLRGCMLNPAVSPNDPTARPA